MINWFPGHMAKSLRELKEKQKVFDLFIILLDARLPLTSFNPEIYKIANKKPILFIFNKTDKTNKDKINAFIPQYQKMGEVILSNLKDKKSILKINSKINNIYKLFDEKNKLKNKLTPPLKCVVLGIPNIGKSTLINALANSRVAKVGNIPGITKSEQWINCNKYLLLDTPGILMPKLSNDDVGAKLAIVDSIRIDALNLNEVIVEIYKLLSKTNKWVLEKINLAPSFDEEQIFAEINQYARRNKILKAGNEIDLNKSIKLLLQYFKNIDNIIYD